MKTITHTMYPVSYIDSTGKQIDILYTFDPTRADPSYWVGEPIEVVAHHPDNMVDTHLEQKIVGLMAEIAALEARKDAS